MKTEPLNSEEELLMSEPHKVHGDDDDDHHHHYGNSIS
jgi:hypothetical protein